VRSILGFLGRFLLFAALLAPLWLLVAPLYDHVLVAVSNVLITPDGYRSSLGWSKATHEWLERRSRGEDPMAPWLVKLIYWSSRTYMISTRTEPLLGYDPLSAHPMSLSTLNFNTIPFLALFLAISGLALRRRLRRIAWAFPLLMSTHLAHIALNFFRITHQTIDVNVRSFASYMHYFGLRFIVRIGDFMEQAGSMLLPFLLWLIFFHEEVLGNLREAMEGLEDGASSEEEGERGASDDGATAGSSTGSGEEASEQRKGSEPHPTP
jgi:hypothetical protein